MLGSFGRNRIRNDCASSLRFRKRSVLSVLLPHPCPDEYLGVYVDNRGASVRGRIYRATRTVSRLYETRCEEYLASGHPSPTKGLTQANVFVPGTAHPQA